MIPDRLYGPDGDPVGSFAGWHPDGFPLYELDPAGWHDFPPPDDDDFDLGPCDPADTDGEDAGPYIPPTEEDWAEEARRALAEDWPDWTDSAGVDLASEPAAWTAWTDEIWTVIE